MLLGPGLAFFNLHLVPPSTRQSHSAMFWKDKLGSWQTQFSDWWRNPKNNTTHDDIMVTIYDDTCINKFCKILLASFTPMKVSLGKNEKVTGGTTGHS